jgi:hypothetical protein
MKPLRLPAAHARRLMSSLRGSMRRLNVRGRLRAPDVVRPIVGPGALVSRRSLCRRYPYGRKRNLSGSLPPPPTPLPCSKIPAEPVSLAITAFTVLPPHPTNKGCHNSHDFEAATGLQRPLSTLHERRCRRPCKTRFRLAGSAFTGRVSNPLGRDERFQSIRHPPFQGFP